jgi:hypothetical protein
MDAVSPTANAPKNVANGSGTPLFIQQQAEFVADERNRADVQHIPPRTVIEDRESTTAAETAIAHQKIVSGFANMCCGDTSMEKPTSAITTDRPTGGSKHEHHGVRESRQGSSRLML